jgi:hypothetical protein
MTKILKDEKLKRYIWRLPQFCRPDWSDEMREKRIIEYNGAGSSAFKLNVEAEIMEGAEGFWDIERVKKLCYNESKRIKYFEVHKDSFHNFRNNIVIEKMAGAEKNYICTDLGYGGTASEVIIIFKVGDKYKYTYNIPLYKLTVDEQIEVLFWIYEILGGGFFGLDNTSDHDVIADGLIKLGVPPDQIVKVNFNSNIEVDFEKDPETGYVVLDKCGQPVMKSIYTQHFSFQELEKLFYNGMMEIPKDEKFFEEMNGIRVKMIGMKPKYDSSTHDDLFQSFQVFAVCRYFLDEFNQLNVGQKQPRCYGVI